MLAVVSLIKSENANTVEEYDKLGESEDFSRVLGHDHVVSGVIREHFDPVTLVNRHLNCVPHVEDKFSIDDVRAQAEVFQELKTAVQRLMSQL